MGSRSRNCSDYRIELSLIHRRGSFGYYSLLLYYYISVMLLMLVTSVSQYSVILVFTLSLEQDNHTLTGCCMTRHHRTIRLIILSIDRSILVILIIIIIIIHSKCYYIRILKRNYKMSRVYYSYNNSLKLVPLSFFDFLFFLLFLGF